MAHPPATRPQILTANCLRQGDVLYWKNNGWVPQLDQAEILAEAAVAEAALAAAQKFVTENRVVAPYLFEVMVENGKVRPVKEREIIRAAGPTVHKHTGKQAGQYNV